MLFSPWFFQPDFCQEPFWEFKNIGFPLYQEPDLEPRKKNLCHSLSTRLAFHWTRYFFDLFCWINFNKWPHLAEPTIHLRTWKKYRGKLTKTKTNSCPPPPPTLWEGCTGQSSQRIKSYRLFINWGASVTSERGENSFMFQLSLYRNKTRDND